MIADINSLLSNNQAVTVTAVSTGVYDQAGLGVGQAVTNIFGKLGGAATVFGQDLGGGGPLASAPQFGVLVTTTFTAAGAATLRAQLQAAIDDGTGNPGTWDTIDQTDDIPVAQLLAGRWAARFTVPERYLGQALPRFYRANYVIGTGPMTAGALWAALLTGIDGAPITPGNF